MHGRKAGYSKLAGIRSREAGVHIALSIETSAHRDHVRMNIQDVSHNLCRRGFMSLSLWTRTYCDHNFAINIELAIRALRIPGKWRMWIDDLRLPEIIRARVQGGADPNSDQAAFFLRIFPLFLPLIPTDQLLRHPHHLRVIARVIHAAIGCCVREFFWQ